jgi:hypothetical protein
MKAVWFLLLLVGTTGCGYSSKGSGSGMTASVAPTVTQLMPSSAMAGGPAFTLTVNGSNFANGAAVYWNGAIRDTTFISASRVTAAIAASDIAVAGVIPVFVKNPGGTGIYVNQPGQSSNMMNFMVTP